MIMLEFTEGFAPKIYFNKKNVIWYDFDICDAEKYDRHSKLASTIFEILSWW